MKKALILVDIQNDYFPGGRFELANPLCVVENVKKVLEHFRSKSYPIIHIQHISLKENAPFFVKGTEGVKIYKDVAPIDGEYIIQKNYPNSFFKTNLTDILRKENITDVVICGMMSHMCIDSTVRGAFEQGLNCTLIEDCCTTRNLTFGDKNINWEDVHCAFMAALSTFSKIVKTSDFLKE